MLNKFIKKSKVIMMSMLVSCASSLSSNAEEISNEELRISVIKKDNIFIETYFAKDLNDKWVTVATNNKASQVTALISKKKTLMKLGAISVVKEKNTLIETYKGDGLSIIKKIKLVDDKYLHVEEILKPDSTIKLQSFKSSYNFKFTPEYSYLPTVGGFCPDAYYKSPVAIYQSNNNAFAIIPDLKVLTKSVLDQCNHALEMNLLEDNHLACGFIPNNLLCHSLFEEDVEKEWSLNGELNNSYYLLLTSKSENQQAYRLIVRFLWNKFGKSELPIAAKQQTGKGRSYSKLNTMDEWRKYVWEYESKKDWLEIELSDGTFGGTVKQRRWGGEKILDKEFLVKNKKALYGRMLSMSSWFNAMRTSYGMACYAKREKNNILMKEATQTFNLACKAPGKDGIFKCIVSSIPKDLQVECGKKLVWGAGDGGGKPQALGYLGYDMSWTAYWMLKWYQAGFPSGKDALPRCKELADFFLKNQLENGMIPSQYNEDCTVNLKGSVRTKAEVGPIALFLLEYYGVNQDTKYLEAALKCFEFLEKEVVESRQWYDYETFGSCSRRWANNTKKLQTSFDEKTGQWPANNLSLGQTVAAYLKAYQLTKDSSYLKKGEALLDYLLLYQQCWTNPFIKALTCKAMLLGGFTTQNADAEWSDARQSQFGNTIIDYYKETGKAEYLERGVQALRAQFPVSPSENWAHTGYGGRAGKSSFHWGTGSGMAGIEINHEDLGDIAVDIAASVAVGVNGINITECKVSGNTISIKMNSPFNLLRKPVIICHNGDETKKYKILINDEVTGVYEFQNSDSLWKKK